MSNKEEAPPYVILIKARPRDLEVEVNRLIDIGYRPVGSLVALIAVTTQFCQPMFNSDFAKQRRERRWEKEGREGKPE